VKPLPQSKGKKPTVKPISTKDQKSIKKLKEGKQEKSKKRKLRLAPDDVKIDLNIFDKTKKKKENHVEIKKEDYNDLESFDDFAKTLQNMIEQRGSSLKLDLCKQYIKDLKDSLERELTFKDIKLASEFFVSQEEKGF